MPGPLIGNPQDVLTTPYGYTGQMAPETAIKEQALNRRRLIANMLMQKGLQQGPGGKMVGRFYVADSPMQGGANLASALAGVLGAKNIDSQQDEVMKGDRQMVTDALNAFKEKQNPQYQSPAESSGIPASALQGQGAPPVPPQAPGQELPPRPDGPYQGEVGAAAMPEVGVQSAQPPIPTQPPALPDVGNRQIPYVDMSQAAPADMGQMVQPPADPSQQPVQAPAPAPPAARFVEPPAPQKPTMNDIADLMTHQHPQVRAYGAMLAQQMTKEQERADQREFQSGEKALDRDVRREGIESNALMRSEMIRGNMINTQAQIDARLQAGRDANDLKAELARQQADLRKAEMSSRADMAKAHDETLKAIATTKQQSKGQLPTSALKMQNEELDAIGAASSIKADMASIRSQIESGKLKLGPMSNLAGQTKNYLGMSDENSRNLASFKASLEKMRNESLRLNKGVQTEGDAVRAWDELVSNMNDPKLVQQRLTEIEAMNDRAVNLRQMNVESIRQNFGVEPLDTSNYQQQPATVGGNKGGGPAKVASDAEFDALPSGAVFVGPDGKTRKKP